MTKQIKLKHKILTIRCCAECPILHDSICELFDRVILGVTTIPFDCLLEES